MFQKSAKKMFGNAKMCCSTSEMFGGVMVRKIALMVLMSLLAKYAKDMVGSAQTVINVSWQKRNVMEYSTVQINLMR